MIGRRKKGYIPHYKIVILGSRCVGKTQIICQYVNHTFQYVHNATTECSTYQKLIDLNEGSQMDPEYCVLEIVDMFPCDHKLLSKDVKKDFSPNEKAHSKIMRSEFMDILQNVSQNPKKEREYYGFMFIYDRTRKETFDDICDNGKFIHQNETMNKKSTKSKFVTKKIAVGNKTDLRGKVFELKTEDKQKILDFKSLANESVQECFLTIARQIHKDPQVIKEIKQDRMDIVEHEDFYNQAEFDEVDDKPSKWRFFCVPMICSCVRNRKEDEGDPIMSESDDEDDATQFTYLSHNY